MPCSPDRHRADTEKTPLTTSDGEFSSGTFHANDRDFPHCFWGN
jgi:hypothetical protein